MNLCINENDRIDEVRFAISLAELMTCYGAAVHEVEDTIASLSAALGMNGHFVLYNKVLFTSSGEPCAERVTLTRFTATRVNIYRLEKLEQVYQAVCSTEISISQGIAELERIKNSKRLYSEFLEFLSWPLISAGFVFILFGSWKELICSCTISVMLYFINSLLSKNDVGTGLRIAVPVAAFIAALFAVLVNKFVFPIAISVVVLSSLMKFMPGFSLTQAMTEIAYRRPVSGMAHLCEAVSILSMLAMGAFLGTAFGSLFSVIPTEKALPILPVWQLCIAGLAVSMSFIFAYDIVKRNIIPVILGSIIVTLLWTMGKEIYGAVYGTGIAAIAGALIANIYSRLSGSSDLVIKIPAAVIIVPGVFGFRSLIEIINNYTVSGLDHALMVFALGAAIVGGFLLVDIIIPPYSHPHSTKAKNIAPLISKRENYP